MELLTKLRFALAKLFGRRQADAELDEEMRFHIDHLIQQHIAEGKSPEEAKRAAMREFGGDLQAKEQCRDQWGTGWLEDLIMDIRFGLRILRKRPLFSLIVIATLALGIGANTAVFSIVHSVLLKPLPYEDPDRIVVLWQRNPETGVHKDIVAKANYLEWTNNATTIEKFGFVSNGGPRARNFLIRNGEIMQRTRARFASAGFFDVLGVKPILGRTFLAKEDEAEGDRVTLLTHAFWQQRFNADPHILGKTLHVKGVKEYDYTIVGVMPPNIRLPEDVQFWLSFSGNPWAAPWGGIMPENWVIARLKPGVTREQAATELGAIQARRAATAKNKAKMATGVLITPMLDQLIGQDTRPILWILLGAVGFVLLIACANVANLVLSQTPMRRKELAIRTAMGASRTRVIRQLVTEGLILSLAGGAAGTLVAWWGIEVLPQLSVGAGASVNEFHVSRWEEAQLSWPVLVFTLAVSVATAIVSGLMPALQASQVSPNEALKDSSSSATENSNTRNFRGWLLTAETAMALVLLIGAGLMVQSFDRMQRRDLGFDPRNVLAAEVDLEVAAQKYPGNSARVGQRIMEIARNIPGIESVGGAGELPLIVSGFLPQISIEGKPLPADGILPVVSGRHVAPGLFETLKIPLRKGRFFTERDNIQSKPVIIINEAFARQFFPGEDPLGKHLLRKYDKMEIIGIVADIRTHSTGPEAVAETYWPQMQARGWAGGEIAYPMVFRTTGDPMKSLAALRDAIEGPKFQGRILLNPRPVESMLADTAAEQEFRTRLMSLFAVIALFLGAIGIYGVMSYSVTQRTHEIGLRMALGAQPGGVLRMVITQGLRLCAIGVIIGLAIAFGCSRLLASFLYEIQATDPVTYILLASLILAVAALAGYLPARRAAKVDPMKALRHE